MLTFAILGLVGCAIALMALFLDEREQTRFESWQDASLKAVAAGLEIPDWRNRHAYQTTVLTKEPKA